MNRREFLRATGGCVLVACGTPHSLGAEQIPTDENVVAIFADTHLRNPQSTQHVQRFNAVVRQLLAMNPRPANLLIYGDVAFDEGKVEEYQLFRELIQPIELAGIRWEVAMGNHDRLDNYRRAFPERFEKPFIIENKLITKVETPCADFLLLDSYKKGCVEGEIDPAQREWLRETLKTYTKPLFVGCHHPLQETQLGEILSVCPCVVAYLYGHNHHWRFQEQFDTKTICFPSTGHWGDLGFVTLQLSKEEARFTPNVDDFFMPHWSNRKEDPNFDEAAYLKRLNQPLVLKMG
ncbi:MAG: metallophosphoesterase [Planctomycetia bacterium]|nr:metallophosphoesterase [Planctomycetia bacterium]